MNAAASNFVTTILLRTTPQGHAVLAKRFSAAQNFYNAMLGECLRRSRLMRESRAWRAAGKMPKGKAKSDAYRALNKKFGFQEYDLYAVHPVGGTCIVEQRRSFIGEHLDSHTCQSLAARAFNAVQRAIFTRGKAHFCRRSEMRSVEGRTDKSPLRWDGKTGSVLWSGLSLPAIIDTADPVVIHGLQSKIGRARIVRMAIRGKERYFAQLVCEGEAYKKAKHKPAAGVVGLDIGPSTIAIVSDKSAIVETFCTELDNRNKQVRTLQRQADRQVRAGNPDCFDEKGRWRKGHRATNISRRLRGTRQRIAELGRTEQAHRKNLHGKLVHQILAQGHDVRTEKLSYRSFQRNFGKSVKFRGPGTFVARLRTEAEKWGASVTEFPTRTTMLSQTCPKCGTLRRKKLSERQHVCSCGASVQRDIASAHLARLVEGTRLDTSKLSKAWKGLCNVLRAVSTKANGPTDGAKARAHPCTGRGPSHEKAGSNLASAGNVVAGRKAQARVPEKPEDAGDYAPVAANVQRTAGETYGSSGLATESQCGSRDVPAKAGLQLDLWHRSDGS